jgi:hypothetical protein
MMDVDKHQKSNLRMADRRNQGEVWRDISVFLAVVGSLDYLSG